MSDLEPGGPGQGRRARSRVLETSRVGRRESGGLAAGLARLLARACVGKRATPASAATPAAFARPVAEYALPLAFATDVMAMWRLAGAARFVGRADAIGPVETGRLADLVVEQRVVVWERGH